ncbi:MAG: hypothetical protein ACYDCI_10270 [Candidatus Limnocylindrales bacterium]
MPTVEDTTDAIANAPTWNARVALVRRVPEDFGTAAHQDVYAAIARRVYVPSITPDFAYVHWRPEYELDRVAAAYELARTATASFRNVSAADISSVLVAHPETLQVFRLMLGLTWSELAETCKLAPVAPNPAPVGKGTLTSIEGGRAPKVAVAQTLAVTIDGVMTGTLYPPTQPGTTLRSKLQKPDTANGWDSVRHYADYGVPLPMFLHQRAFGGAFRQLLDATSKQRGDVLEDEVTALFTDARVPFIRTGAHNQAEIERRFGLTVKPAPDFVVYEAGTDTVRAILECKGTNDGGTARDKAARFRSLRTESQRLGGVPVFAVLGGTGWRRTRDALGPVVRDTDGRTFTLATLHGILETEPFPSLLGHVTGA